jgi:hypothetical protein
VNERIEVGTVTDAERRYGLTDPSRIWYLICSGRSFEWNGKWVTLFAERYYPGTTTWVVEAIEA